MTVKTLERKIQTLERRIKTYEMVDGWTSHSESKKAELQRALSTVAGMWAKRPRTAADLKRVRKQLGLD